ncbi:hypothetical protein J2T60_001280 [Natronospira proteinivora]|uniref:DUF4241 domain-containing protein n=1 Tax=Natronospira proteinivora TaxID=1807133 RepID=A0ABT1G8T2_9GAMM|nr:hypothetical protein [Natronospira proteinivora]MCP1727315.1 hypothetical protein [Natronospira proteinivora]
MAYWSVEQFSERFHSEPSDTLIVEDDAIDEVDLAAGDPMAMPSPARQTLENVHRQLRRSWVTGGVVFQAWELDDSEEDDDSEDPGPETVVSLLWSLADTQDLPPDVAGCSIAWLADARIWPETTQQFGDALFRALRDGGVLGDGLDAGQAQQLTEQYLEALLDDTPKEDLFLFGLDPGFSCWFCDGEYDIAYAIINLDAGWFALFLATDSED